MYHRNRKASYLYIPSCIVKYNPYFQQIFKLLFYILTLHLRHVCFSIWLLPSRLLYSQMNEILTLPLPLSWSESFRESFSSKVIDSLSRLAPKNVSVVTLMFDNIDVRWCWWCSIMVVSACFHFPIAVMSSILSIVYSVFPSLLRLMTSLMFNHVDHLKFLFFIWWYHLIILSSVLFLTCLYVQLKTCHLWNYCSYSK